MMFWAIVAGLSFLAVLLAYISWKFFTRQPLSRFEQALLDTFR
jgi:hypothetical protein